MKQKTKYKVRKLENNVNIFTLTIETNSSTIVYHVSANNEKEALDHYLQGSLRYCTYIGSVSYNF